MSSSLDETEEARARYAQRFGRSELVAQAVVAALFLVAAGLLLALGHHERVDALDLGLLVVAAALLGRLEFESGAGYAGPTQLIFLPRLFVPPPALVPPAVAAALLLDRVPAVLTGRRHPQRLLTVLGDAWFAVGPALVFELADVGTPSLGDWPLYLLALPLAALLSVFARERRARIGHAIELSAAYRGTARLLGDVLSSDDEYTGVHSEGVVTIALVIADELRLDEDERRLVEFGAMLHDIGKITTPKEILHKPGALSDEDWVIMRDHTLAGQRLLDRVGGMLRDVGVVVRSSHERYDGNGYPDGLRAEAIPLAARVVAVADAYSAMTTRRTYREPMTPGIAMAELRLHAGSQFDPAVVEAALVVLARDANIEIPATNATDPA
ncbi:MAG: hypothetical protein QOD37_1556 [Gaiellales bacterium]|nr:hypothetical protein [Gaiellales bacterium]